MFAAYHNRLSPKWFDYISYYWDTGAEEWVEFARDVQNWELQDGIKHPYMNQYTVSIERELFRDASISVSYINRQWKNIIGVYDLQAVYDAFDYYVSPLDQNFTVWELTSGSAHQFSIENIKESADRPYILGNPYRKYQGLEFLFNKRFSNRWQLLLSYVYAKTEGTIDNTWGDDIGWNSQRGLQAGDPNFWTNADGYSTFDPRHMVKLQGTYILPLDISFTASFRAIAGTAWTREFRTRTLDQGRVTFLTEPRGSNHYDMQKLLDLRAEKIFTLAKKYRLGVIIDCFNVFNADTITSWGTRIGYDWLLPDDPDYTASTQGHDLYGIVNPRQFRLGIRLIF
jgi:hypothetical protein